MTRARQFGDWVSPEAEAVIAEWQAWWQKNPPPGELPTVANVERMRADHRTRYEAGFEAAAEETGAVLQDIYLGEVRTLRVTVEDRHEAALLYFFGGSFMMGGPDEDVTITAPLAQLVGVPVYGPYYSLSPEVTFPVALDEGVATYRALLDTYPADRLAILGTSAGGNLAFTVSLKAIEEGLPSPAAVVGISPWADLTFTGHSKEIDTDPTMKADEPWAEVASNYAGETPLESPLVSPLFADYPPLFPPTLITTGTRDILLSDCARLSTVMRRAGVDASVHVWEGMWHVFEHWHDVPEARESIKEISRFLTRHLNLSD